MKLLSLFALLVLFSAPATAYVGPGLGLGVVGTIFGVLTAIVLALFGLFWYPLKRAYNRRKASAEGSQFTATINEQEPAAQQDSRVAGQLNTASKNASDNHAARLSDVDSEVTETVAGNQTDKHAQ